MRDIIFRVCWWFCSLLKNHIEMIVITLMIAFLVGTSIYMTWRCDIKEKEMLESVEKTIDDIVLEMERTFKDKRGKLSSEDAEVMEEIIFKALTKLKNKLNGLEREEYQ